jgi:glucokinase
MAFLGIDLGGTKLALAIYNSRGESSGKESVAIGDRSGKEVGKLITGRISAMINVSESAGDPVISIGISVPGISHQSTGTVWAPNIPGWDDYPLLKEVKAAAPGIPVTIDSDRACYILGEAWLGAAKGCRDAIFLSVGTGIGAGIMTDGVILRGSHDIAGCIGWMAMQRPYDEKFRNCGCFEYFASGEGIARLAREMTEKQTDYTGSLSRSLQETLKAADVFEAYDRGDTLALEVVNICIGFWGMAVANLVSLFNPEKIIFGGGVFGPGVRFLPEILAEARKWAQPVGMTQVSLASSALGGDAGVCGAAYLAFRNYTKQMKNLSDEL